MLATEWKCSYHTPPLYEIENCHHTQGAQKNIWERLNEVENDNIIRFDIE